MAVFQPGEIDAIQSLMIHGTEGDFDIQAGREIMDGFNGLYEPVPGQIGAGPLQSFNQNPGIDESLQTHKAGPVFGVIALQKRQVAGISGKKRDWRPAGPGPEAEPPET